jgi:hypothetical protein
LSETFRNKAGTKAVWKEETRLNHDETVKESLYKISDESHAPPAMLAQAALRVKQAKN